MTLPETSLVDDEQQHHYAHDDEEEAMSDDDIFGPARTILRRTKNKVSMISNDLRLREKRKRVLQLCLRKLERIKDSENNLRRSVVIHNTFSRLSNDIKRDKAKNQNRNQHHHHQQQQQQRNNKELQQQQSQKLPKKAEKLDFENLEELCSIDDNGLPIYDPILKNSEEIEQALSRKRKAEVEKALLSYHQLEKRLKSDISNAVISNAFRDVVAEGHHNNDLNMPCSNNNNLLNSFQTTMCSKAAALDSSSNGIFQSLVIKSLET